MQEHAGGVHHRPQQVETDAFGTLARRRRVAGGDRSAGCVHQQRVGKADVGKLTCQGVDRRRTHIETLSAAKL